MTKFISLLWGLAESTVFFIVPDVWLTAVSLKLGKREITEALCWCVLGAVIGGSLIYGVAFMSSTDIRPEFGRIPGISNAMIERVSRESIETRVVAIFKGMFSGIPYKLFAAEWGERKWPLWIFIILSVVARTARFLFSIFLTLIVRWIGKRRLPNWPVARWYIFVGFWVILYTIYFLRVGW